TARAAAPTRTSRRDGECDARVVMRSSPEFGSAAQRRLSAAPARRHVSIRWPVWLLVRIWERPYQRRNRGGTGPLPHVSSPSAARPGRAGVAALRHVLAQPGLAELSRGIQDRIGDRGQVRVDSLEIAQHVEVEAARLDAVEIAAAQAGEVILRGDPVELAEG